MSGGLAQLGDVITSFKKNCRRQARFSLFNTSGVKSGFYIDKIRLYSYNTATQ